MSREGAETKEKRKGSPANVHQDKGSKNCSTVPQTWEYDQLNPTKSSELDVSHAHCCPENH